MKIIFTVTNDLSYDQRMIRICSCLAEEGYTVHLIGRKRKSSIALRDRPFVQKRLPCFFDKGKLFYLEYNLRLLFYLFWQSCHAICAIDLDTVLPAYLVAKIRKRHIIYDAHEYFTEVPEVVRRPRIKAIWEKIAIWTLPHIPHNYTVGPKLAALFTERYQQNYALIRNVPFKRHFPDKKEIDLSKIILLYQGALNEGRGLEALIDAMNQLPSHYTLWLAGEGDLSQELRNRASQLQLGSRIQFLGFVSPENLHQITPQAHLGFNLLENKGLSYYYSLANKCFDYIQAGLPSFNMNFPEYQDLNRQYRTFLLVDDLDPDNLAQKIQELFNNPDNYKNLVKHCKAAAKILNWENEQQKLIHFYQQIFS